MPKGDTWILGWIQIHMQCRTLFQHVNITPKEAEDSTEACPKELVIAIMQLRAPHPPIPPPSCSLLTLLDQPDLQVNVEHQPALANVMQPAGCLMLIIMPRALPAAPSPTPSERSRHQPRRAQSMQYPAGNCKIPPCIMLSLTPCRFLLHFLAIHRNIRIERKSGGRGAGSAHG